MKKSIFGLAFVPFILGVSNYSAFAKKPLNEATILTVPAWVSAMDQASRELAELGPQDTLKPAQKISTKYQASYRFKHYHNGIEVLGSEVNVDRAVHSSLIPIKLSESPTISTEEIESIIHSKQPVAFLLSQPTLKILPSKTHQNDSLLYLAEIQEGLTFYRTDVWIDAHSGKILAWVPQIRMETTTNGKSPLDVVSFSKMRSKDIDPSTGMPNVFDFSRSDVMAIKGKLAAQASESGKRAFFNADKTYRYYFEVHGRDSFDAEGSKLVSFVDVGKNLANAFWASGFNIMAYGEGDGEYIRDLTYGVDVAGHEMTHGVIQETVDLLPFGEAGALNEGLADFFGERIEGSTDGIVGNEVFIKPMMGQSAIRNINDPSSMPLFYFNESDGELVQTRYPKRYSEKIETLGSCEAQNDYCWVHANSTIPSHFMYRIQTLLGAEKAETIIFHTLAHKLKQTSGFRDFAKSIVETCYELNEVATQTDCATVEHEAIDLEIMPLKSISENVQG